MQSISPEYERFCRNLVALLSTEGYRFAIPETGLTARKPESFWSSIMTPGLVGAILSGPLFSGTPKSTSELELRKELTELQETCRLAACKIIAGWVHVAVLLEADERSEAELIGISSLMHEKLRAFRKFSTPMFNTWEFWQKLSPTLFDSQTVRAQLIITFNHSPAATMFSLKTAQFCKHRTGATWTLPMTVDVPAQRIEKWPGWPLAGATGCSIAKMRDQLFINTNT